MKTGCRNMEKERTFMVEHRKIAPKPSSKRVEPSHKTHVKINIDDTKDYNTYGRPISSVYGWGSSR